MRPVDDEERWNRALIGEHYVVSTATSIRTGKDPVELPGLETGQVTLDGAKGTSTRGQCDLTFIGDEAHDLIPEISDDPLAPYGQQIQVRRGIVTPDGYSQMISLGIFRVQDTDPQEDESGNVTITVTGFDKSKRIADAKFLTARQIPAGSDYLDTMQDIILEVDANAEFIFPSRTILTPLLNIAEGDDRWKFLQDMAEAIGMDIYVDGDGLYILSPVPNLQLASAVAEVVEGNGGLLTSASPKWTREGAFNAVIYTGENTSNSTIPRGFAFDDEPSSPTYFYSDFGQVPTFETSSFLTTDDQALAAAQGKLNKELGTFKSIDFGAIVNPRLEPDDIILVKRERLKVNENHIIDNLVIPLGPEEKMQCSSRSTLV